MPRSKLKNRKSNRKLNSKLRNKCGGAAGKSPDRPGKKKKVGPARRSPSPSRPASPRTSSSSPQPPRSSRWGPRTPSSSPQPRRSSRGGPRSRSPSPPPSRRRSPIRPPSSPRRSSRSSNSNSSSNNSRNPEGFLRILQQGPMAKRLFGNLTPQEIASFQQVSTNTHRAVKTIYPNSSAIIYAFLIDIYNNPELKEVIEKIKQINLTDKKNVYLQNAEKLKEIQQVYKNKELTEKEDKIERTGTMIDDLIAIFFKDFNLHKSKKTTSSFENYMNYLSKKSSKFDKYSEDINKDIDKDIAILTLFYGFSDTNLRLIFIYTGNKSEILNDYIYLLNELFTKHTGEKFYTHFDLISSVPGVAHWFNREGIKEYVKKITDSKKPHAEVLKELKENSEFLRPDN